LPPAASSGIVLLVTLGCGHPLLKSLYFKIIAAQST